VNRRVVVTGVGAVTPLGVGAQPLIDRWSAGECGIADGLGVCRDFDASELLDRKTARRSDRFTQLALVAADEALAQAGWSGGDGPLAPERVGCVIGTGIGGIGTIEDQHDILAERGPGSVSPLGIPLLMANAAAGAVAMRHDLKGQCYGTVSACAAGAHAVGTGLRMIRYGDADACIVGGTESALTPLAKAAFAAMAATSPTGVSRPFDARRDGFVMGEGAGVLVLEDEQAALARGATPLALLAGYGATADAHHITAPEPSGEGAQRAMLAALADAGRTAAEVDYINAHGTSTPLNDRAETVAIKAALGARATEIPVSSTKSVVGHLLGAAGAVEAVATTLALQRRVAPPTVGWAEREDDLDLDYVPDLGRTLSSNGRQPVALSNSFGFGGHNAVLCLEAL
jgi:3-oxoacyl-[acyl-carrier-protein] synthase II